MTRHRALRPILWAHLLQLPFTAFARCCQQLLERLGYTDVQLRGVERFRGRNSHGGHDLEGSACTGLTQVRFLAQVKQYREPVPRAFVDELRGAMLRLGADKGILITTSTFSPAARKAAESSVIAPIRLVEGEELLDLLLVHHLGVCPDPSRPGRWRIDVAYFAGLGSLTPTPACPLLLPQSAPKPPTGKPETGEPVRSPSQLTITLAFGQEKPEENGNAELPAKGK